MTPRGPRAPPAPLGPLRTTSTSARVPARFFRAFRGIPNEPNVRWRGPGYPHLPWVRLRSSRVLHGIPNEPNPKNGHLHGSWGAPTDRLSDSAAGGSQMGRIRRQVSALLRLSYRPMARSASPDLQFRTGCLHHLAPGCSARERRGALPRTELAHRAASGLASVLGSLHSTS